MKKYVICVDNGENFNAASKARQDAEKILLARGCEPLHYQTDRSAEGNRLKQILLFFHTIRTWNSTMDQAEPNNLVVFQYPFFPLKTVFILNRLLPRTQKKKNLKFLALIHDLNSLRGFYGKTANYSDKQFLKHFDQIISHNQKMTEYLQSIGIPKEKITELRIFDYLTEATPKTHSKQDGIAIAGNLDPEKSGYISRLITISNKRFPIHLYGKGLTGRNEDKNITFHGAFPPDILPGELEGAFGLVWDGSSADTCKGPTGNYLKYNNPHKLSLYLSSGMPVMIWKEAAEAEFIRTNNVGILIDSLDRIEQEIQSISEEEYLQMAQNAWNIGRKLRVGEYLAVALVKSGNPTNKM